jgi:hypothetical protein
VNFLKISLFLFLPFIFIGCSSDISSVKREMVPDELKDAERYIQIVQSINKKRPDYISADISIKASINGKSFKTAGTLNYTSTPQTLRARLNDTIFRSTMADLFLENGILKMYIPVDNIMYVNHQEESTKENIEIDPSIISSTALSVIPLISDAKAIRLYRENTNSNEQVQKIMVLENDGYFESLFFTADLPVKILIISKVNGKKTEIHYENAILKEGINFYTLVKVTSELSGNSAEINFSNLKLNVPFDRTVIFNFSVPKGTRIIEQ